MRARRPKSAHRTAQLAVWAAEKRWSPTPSEALLWEELRSRKLGVLFRRQVVIGEWVVDFLAPEVRLVVEVDGGWHAGRERKDARRDRGLEAAGYRVVRVEAEVVLREVERAVSCVRAAIGG